MGIETYFMMYLALSMVWALTFTSSGWLLYVSFFHCPYRRYLEKSHRKRNFRTANSAAHSKGRKQIILLTCTGMERFWTFPIIPQTCMHCSPSRKEMEARPDQWYSTNSWTVFPGRKTKPKVTIRKCPKAVLYMQCTDIQMENVLKKQLHHKIKTSRTKT